MFDTEETLSTYRKFRKHIYTHGVDIFGESIFFSSKEYFYLGFINEKESTEAEKEAFEDWHTFNWIFSHTTAKGKPTAPNRKRIAANFLEWHGSKIAERDQLLIQKSMDSVLAFYQVLKKDVQGERIYLKDMLLGQELWTYYPLDLNVQEGCFLWAKIIEWNDSSLLLTHGDTLLSLEDGIDTLRSWAYSSSKSVEGEMREIYWLSRMENKKVIPMR